YQYQAFGVPALGLKRGLGDDLVVAPYATALALAIAPREAVRNLRALERAGLGSEYGNYEAIDYTPRRLSEGESSVVVCSYMAHHQGMTLVALDNALHGDVMPARFHADPRIRATESLLFERVPLAPAVAGGERDGPALPRGGDEAREAGSRYGAVDSALPRVQPLGGQSYALVVTSAGGGYSRWRDLDVTRWSADTTRDDTGSFIYVRDLEDGTTWSAAHQPVGLPATRYSAYLTPARVELDRQDVGIGTRTEIAVSSEDDAEVRRVTLANLSDRVRRIEVTSYAELALAAHAADRAHPAFSKLFVRTEALPPGGRGGAPALLAWRTPRSGNDPAMWAVHVLALAPGNEGSPADPEVQLETNRGRFIGRGRSVRRPLALEGDLSNDAGYVLDPIFSLRCRITLAPGERRQLAFVTGAAADRAGVVSLAEKYHDLRAVERVLDLSRSQAQLLPRQLRVTVGDLERFRRLASHVLFPSAALRAAEQTLRANRLGQTRLWAQGISGDLPIVLVQIGDALDLELAREALAAHAYWRLQGLKADLVILDDEAVGYEQPLRDGLQRLAQTYAQGVGLDQPGGIFLRRAGQLPPEDVALLLAAARVALVAARGSLEQQLAALDARSAEAAPAPPAALRLGRRVREEPSAPLPFMELPYFNGYGGFTPDGREYVIYLGPGVSTPAPWVNVMANPTFGALVSEAGQGMAWWGNSQSNRLLPWSNDPVSDPAGDALFIRDEESGVYWTPTAAPVRELDAYRARHGQGQSVFEHNSHAIEQELLVCVPVDDRGGEPLRLQRLRLRNASSRRRRLSVTSYAEWVLGANREETQMHVVSGWDAEAQALLAVNRFHPQWGERVAFASASVPVRSYTADRTEFLGRNGRIERPAALTAQSLSGRVGAGLDPCAALQVAVELEPGETTEVSFVLGQAADAAQARRLARALRDPAQVDAAVTATGEWWDELLGTVQVETPDAAVNFLLNRWLPYQTLSCRIWGRSAFYQSGGAFGFRDQLQDGMALVYARPALVRELLLTAAAHQFPEGDVQHWWHPESGAGIRTRFSDDLLWLPYVVAHYVGVTGDTTVLDEGVP
ncbi:MAG TPA: glucoamylase family protein, partial [Chloroflexota bacterium]|nr:glucoamylase family protein [Chloroflexota bacterium]